MTWGECILIAVAILLTSCLVYGAGFVHGAEHESQSNREMWLKFAQTRPGEDASVPQEAPLPKSTVQPAWTLDETAPGPDAATTAQKEHR